METNTESLSDRMKRYEVERSFLNINTCVFFRLDGRSFSSKTKKIKGENGFSEGFANAMQITAGSLLHEFNFDVCYVQSDEITLMYKPIEEPRQPIFDYRRDKLVSILSSTCTAYFMKYFSDIDMPTFDCRVWSVKDRVGDIEYTEPSNVFMWRQLDCVRNSISMFAQNFFSSKSLLKKNSSDKLKMLSEYGKDWSELSAHLKYGTFIKKMSYDRYLLREYGLSDRIKMLFGTETLFD